MKRPCGRFDIYTLPQNAEPAQRRGDFALRLGDSRTSRRGFVTARRARDNASGKSIGHGVAYSGIDDINSSRRDRRSGRALRKRLKECSTSNDTPAMALRDIVFCMAHNIHNRLFLRKWLSATAMKRSFFVFHDESSLYPSRAVRKKKRYDCT